MKTQLLWLFGLFCCIYGLESHCVVQKNEDKCYGTPGGSLVIKLVERNEEFKKCVIKKNTQIILNWQDGQFRYNQDKSKYFFGLENGSLTIASINWNDNDSYSFDIFDQYGNLKLQQTFLVYVEAPVSYVNLTSECLPNGTRIVSCNVQDESLFYKWTLDGQNLTDVQLQSGSSDAKTIILKAGVLGRLACTVGNNVMNKTTEKQISECGFTPNNSSLFNDTCTPGLKNNQSKCRSSDIQDITPVSPELVGGLVVVVVLLGVGAAVAYVYWKKRKAVVDTEELTYADVNIVNHGAKRQYKEAEEAVAYSEVRFQRQPQRTAQPVEESPVYSMVQKVL